MLTARPANAGGAWLSLSVKQELAREKKDFDAHFNERKEKAMKDGGKLVS
jgi:hypothetical protein